MMIILTALFDAWALSKCITMLAPGRTRHSSSPCVSMAAPTWYFWLILFHSGMDVETSVHDRNVNRQRQKFQLYSLRALM